MKKLTLFMVACLTTLVGFAAGGNITYNLDGGVTNDYGWTNKSDMFTAFMTDAGATATDLTLADFKGMANPYSGEGIGKYLLNCSVLNDNAEKWGWFKDYLIQVTTDFKAENPSSTAADLAATPLMTAAAWRYSVAAFFVEGVMTGWPYTADFTVAGLPDAFMPVWKHAFAGPATYDGSAEVPIPTPYKEDATFDGWYEEPAFTTKVTSIPAGAEGDKTFYAKWIEYIPTCAEVWAVEAGNTTKAKGVAGTVTATGNYVKLTSAAVSGVPAKADMPAIQAVALATLKADAKPYMFEYVSLSGVKIVSYDGDKVVLTDDGTNNIDMIVAGLSQSAFPVGTLLNVRMTVSFDGTNVYLTGQSLNVSAAPVPRPDPFVYPARHDGVYTLTSKWLVSNNMDNLVANPVGSEGFVRGMVAQGGKMYFVDRDKKQLTVFDGATGERLSPIRLDENLFSKAGDDGVMSAICTLPYNDIKVDSEGNVLVGAGTTSNREIFRICKINLETGAATTIINDTDLAARFSVETDTIYGKMRFDAFGVYGDVDNEGYILAADANSMTVYKWLIEGGEVVLPTEDNDGQIFIDVADTTSYLNKLGNPGTAPQVFPISEDLFYLDGNGTYPTVIDMGGSILDDFKRNASALIDSITNPSGESWTMNQGHNGVLDFQVGDDYFLLMAASNTVKAPFSSFRLFKYANAKKEFSGLECLWTFPAAGMGEASNTYRTAVPSVEVDQENAIATIYLYTGANGYGVYEFQGQKSSSVPQISGGQAVNVFVDGSTLRLSEEVAQVYVYSLNGQLVAQASNVSSIDVVNNGLYVVKAFARNGETAIHKVIVK